CGMADQPIDVTALVLASGASRRFGSAKQLFEIDGESLVRRAARVAREVAPTIVVIADDSLRAALAGLDVTIIHNSEADEGIASSIRAGVAACRGDVLITLCDQPEVTSAHLRRLIDTHAALAATSYGGTIGAPALFPAPYRRRLLLPP